MYCNPKPKRTSKPVFLAMALMAAALLGAPESQAVDLGEANECLELKMQAEREACLRMYIDQVKLLNELRQEIGEDKPKAEEETEVTYDLPQPIGIYSGPKTPLYIEFAYRGGVITGQKGDLLVSGWRIKEVSKTSVVLSRRDKDVVLGYGGEESSGSAGTPIMPPVPPMQPVVKR